MKLSTTLLLLTLSGAIPGIAQERGNWRPASKTAQSVTGDIAFGNEKLMINFLSIAIAQIRPLTPAEIPAVFDGADATTGTGHLYRLSVPGDKRFLHKNTLCGSDETQWMATFVSGKELNLAFFSNATPPVFTLEAISSNANLCGTYTYTR